MQTVMVLINPQDLGIVNVWMRSLFLNYILEQP